MRSPSEFAHRWDLLEAASLDLTRIRLIHDERGRLEPDATRRREAEETARRREREGRPLQRDASGRLLPLYRFVRPEWVGDDLLHLHVGTTDYAEYLATNVAQTSGGAAASREAERLADPLALTCVVVTADGFVPLGIRSAKVESPGRLQPVPAGHPHPPQSLAEALEQELLEETGIRWEETRDRLFTGLIRHAATRKPEACFVLHTELAFAEIERRAPRDAWEFDAIVPLRWRPSDVEAWLRANVETASPAGHAAVYLAARAARLSAR